MTTAPEAPAVISKDVELYTQHLEECVCVCVCVVFRKLSLVDKTFSLLYMTSSLQVSKN